MAGKPGRSGRRPKPPILKVLHGGKDRRPADMKAAEAKPTIAMTVPEPNKDLPPKAKEYWRRLAKELWPIGLLTNADLSAFEQLCLAYSDWQHSLEQKRKGYWVRDDSKPHMMNAATQRVEPAKMVNPYIKIEREDQKRLARMEIEFGLTPSSRSRVKPSTPTGMPVSGADDNNDPSRKWNGLISSPPRIA